MIRKSSALIRVTMKATQVPSADQDLVFWQPTQLDPDSLDPIMSTLVIEEEAGVAGPSTSEGRRKIQSMYVELFEGKVFFFLLILEFATFNSRSARYGKDCPRPGSRFAPPS